MRPDEKDIEITDESGAASGAGVSESENENPTANEEHRGSTGTLPHEAEFDRIPVGNTGSNVRRDRNLEKSGPEEA
ncbi:MAG TPA: hypothetical protein VF691_18950 [Cytophagaceae bacterium]|jgi:hypothetical protein